MISRAIVAISALLAVSYTTGVSAPEGRATSPHLRAGSGVQTSCELPSGAPIVIDALGAVETEYGIAGLVIEESGHYVVGRDLTVPDVDIGILINAYEVSLDFAGHSISSPRETAAIVHIAGTYFGNNVSIRDGSIEGGATGISTETSREGVRVNHLEIAGMRIVGDSVNSGFKGIVVDAESLRLQDNIIHASHTGVSMSARHSWIVGNKITAGLVALEGPQRAEISENMLEAQQALRGDSGNTVRLNTIIGIPPKDGQPDEVTACAAWLWEENIISHNLIRGSQEAALCVSGANLIARNTLTGRGGSQPKHVLLLGGDGNLVRDNRIEGGGEASIGVSSNGNRITGNILRATDVGIRIAGIFNFIERNMFRGPHLSCGIDFAGSLGNVHGGNRGGGICGNPNVSVEGNGFARSTSVSRTTTPRTSGRARDILKCDSPNVTLLSELHRVETEDGPVGIHIDAPGQYLLTRNLTVSDPDGLYFNIGILITAPDVILDLGGHTLEMPDGHPVQIVGSRNVTIRNGTLRGPSDLGLTATGDGTLGSRLTLENLRISSGGMCAIAANITDVRHVEILSSIIGSNYGGIDIHGNTTGRIVDNIITASEHGLRLSGFHDGEIVGNIFTGGRLHEPLAMSGGAGNLLAGNLLAGGDTGLALGGEDNLVLDNTIHGGSSEGSAADISGQGNRLRDNMIVGVGEYYGSKTCGMEFRGEGHVFRGNIVLNVDEGVCGQPAIDEGGNLLNWGCGDGRRSDEETCDLYDIEAYCSDFGYDGGTLRCNESCDGYDASECTKCGDGAREGDERCDGVDFGGETCSTLPGGYGGSLVCADGCFLDTSGCTTVCGDGVRLGLEVCDGQDLAGNSCRGLGFRGGSLMCRPACDAFDTSWCY